MEVIFCEKKSAYIKRRSGKFELTTDKTKASLFSCGYAKLYIANKIPKKLRGDFSVEEISPPPKILIPLPPIQYGRQIEPPRQIDDMNITSESVLALTKEYTENFCASLDKLAERARAELAFIDNVILDYRHWIRNKATSLNAVQGYKAYKLHTELERRREDLKKALNLCRILYQQAKETQSLAEDFEFEPYNPRTDTDFDELIKGSSK